MTTKEKTLFLAGALFSRSGKNIASSVDHKSRMLGVIQEKSVRFQSISPSKKASC